MSTGLTLRAQRPNCHRPNFMFKTQTCAPYTPSSAPPDRGICFVSEGQTAARLPAEKSTSLTPPPPKLLALRVTMMHTVGTVRHFEHPVAHAGEVHHKFLAWGPKGQVRRRLTKVQIWISDSWSNGGEQRRPWLRDRIAPARPVMTAAYSMVTV